MKYNALKHENDLIVVVEDGGIVVVENVDHNPISVYYQSRLTDELCVKTDPFAHLDEGKVYLQAWKPNTPVRDLIVDAFNWLVVPNIDADQWVYDESLFRDYKLL
jgi:hypothetical protein